MRTADWVVAGAWHFPLGIDEQRDFDDWVSSAVAQSPVIVADNVAGYIDQRGTPNLTDLPSLAPPWPSFWIEYPSTSGRQRRGVLVVDSTGSEESDDHFRLLTETAKHEPIRAGEPRWTVTFVLFTETGRRSVWGPLGMSTLTLDDHGAVLGHAWSVAPMLEIGEAARAILDEKPPEAELIDVPAPLTVAEIRALGEAQAQKLFEDAEAREAALFAQLHALNERVSTLKEVRHAIYGAAAATGGNDPDATWLTRALAPAYQAVAFLHCKNVSLDEVTPAAKVQAKRRRRGKKPLVRYHTLRLDVPRRGGGGNGHSDASATSLHIVAGHFAHYGACCENHPPHGRLFGRLEGIYWVPTHARGDKQIGTVRTDFDLRIPA